MEGRLGAADAGLASDPVRCLDTRLRGPRLIEATVHGDQRGFFLETYRRETMADLGVDVDFVQDNHSRSSRGVLRGMHFQVGEGQAKLVRCVRGSIFDVLVDLRRGSPTFGEWEAHELSDANAHQLFAPVGFAHGFCVTSDVADVTYKCSTYYDPAAERGIAFDDPDVGIAWPDGLDLRASERDRRAPRLSEVAHQLPFVY